MDYVKPDQVMHDMIEAGAAKARLKTSQMLIRGILSGAILACATTLAFTISTQTNIPMAGALLFPVGFVIIVVLGLELVTESFALLPLAVLQKKAWLWNQIPVLIGSFIGGSVFTGAMPYFAQYEFGKRRGVARMATGYSGLGIMEATAVSVEKRR